MMEGRQDFQPLGSAGVTEALWSGLPWTCRKQLGAAAPADVCLPSGRADRTPGPHSNGQPALAVKL